MRNLLCVSFLLLGLNTLAQNVSKTEITTINGKKVAYISNGLLTRKATEPILVFENGGASPKTDWQVIFPHLAKTTPWLTYDRSGLYESELDSTILTDRDVVNRLHQLLQAIKASPPFILIGHSYGGPLIRLYTALYPQEVSGLVFVDPTNFMYKAEDEQKLKAVSGTVGWNGMWEKFMAKFDENKSLPKGIRAEMNRIIRKDQLGYFADYTSLPPLPDIPIRVLLAYNAPADPQGEATAKELNLNLGPTYFQAAETIRLTHFTKLLENNSKAMLILLPTFPHYVFRKDSALVAGVIEDVLKKSFPVLPK